MRHRGNISDWQDDKGFGFISPEAGGGRLFAHIKAFANRQRRPGNGDGVSYLLSTDDRGRPCAVKIAFDGERYEAPVRRSGAQSASRGNGPVLFAIFFVALLVAATAAERLPLEVAGLYVVASVVTLRVYAWDKSAARRDDRRTPENTLHLLALVGGWPGALTAQRWLRHKSSKQSFQTMFWVTVVLNCGALIWLITPHGSAKLDWLLGLIRSFIRQLI